MEEIENNVTLEETENTEAQTVEEIDDSIELTDTSEVQDEETPETEEEQPKGRFITEEEINEIVDKRVSRKLKKIERENEKEISKYRDTENVLRTTLELNEDDDVNTVLRERYKEQGIELPEKFKPDLSSHEIEILAKADAQDIIDEGYDVMVEEANRLADKGYKNLNEREKIVFNTVANKLTEENNTRELLKLGAKKELLNDKDFISFKSKFNPNTPIGDIYALYNKIQPKKQVTHPGSMKNNNTHQGVKDFYTPDEVKRLSPEDWEKPGVWESVMASQSKWEK